MKYKAICFDIDGTLYPIGTMNRRIFRLSVTHPIFGLKYRKARREFRRHQAAFRQDIPFRWREAMIVRNGTGAEGEDVFSEESFRAKYGRTYDRLHSWTYDKMGKLYEKTTPFNGVAETFAKIKNNGLKIGVFTDFPLFHKLQAMNLEKYVDFAASSDDVLNICYIILEWTRRMYSTWVTATKRTSSVQMTPVLMQCLST